MAIRSYAAGLDNRELDRIPYQDGLSLAQLPKDQYQPRLQSHRLEAKTWQCKCSLPAFFPYYPGAGPERWRKMCTTWFSKKAGTICCNPPCARGDGTGHIACEIARLLVYSTTGSRHLDPGRRGKAPSGAQNRTSVYIDSPGTWIRADRTRCVRRVVSCRVVYCTQQVVLFRRPPFALSLDCLPRGVSGHGAPSRRNGGND